jgi:hypothetical protein
VAALYIETESLQGALKSTRESETRSAFYLSFPMPATPGELQARVNSSLLAQYIIHQRHNSKRDEQCRQRYRRDKSEVLETDGTG